jgi:hypothetical protein
MSTFAVFVAVDFGRQAELTAVMAILCAVGLAIWIGGRLAEDFTVPASVRRMAAALVVAVVLAIALSWRLEAVYFPYPCDIYWFDPYCWKLPW